MDLETTKYVFTLSSFQLPSLVNALTALFVANDSALYPTDMTTFSERIISKKENMKECVLEQN